LTYISNENCATDATKKATFNITLLCDMAGSSTTATLNSNTPMDQCTSTATYSTKAGCYLYQVPVGKIIKAIAPFLGAILIIFGLLMTFAGAKFLFICVAI